MATATCTLKTLIKDQLAEVVPPGARRARRDRAVVFVHGFRGDAQETWKAKDATESFPALLATDPELIDHDFFLFQYVTKDLSPPAIDNIVVQLKFALKEHVKHPNIIFLAHSMGGLVCTRCILALLEDGRLDAVCGLLLYGSPMSGVEWVRYAQMVLQFGAWKFPPLKLLSRVLKTNRQLEALTTGSQFIDRMNSDWVLRALNGGHPKVPAEQRAWFPVRVVTGNDDWVVKESSARGFYSKIDWINADQDHFRLVKPVDRSELTYQIAREFLNDCRNWMDQLSLLKLRRQIDSIWALHRKRGISHWRFDLIFEKQELTSQAGQFGMSGFRSFSVLECSYCRRLANNYLKFGFANGNIAAGRIWDDEFAFLHSLRFGALSAAVGGALQEELRTLIDNDDFVWNRLFKNVTIRVRQPDEESVWHILRPGDVQKVNDGLVQRYDVPEEAHGLVGKEVLVDVAFSALLPISINDYTVEFPWLCDGFNVSVTIKGGPSYLIASQALRGSATVHSKREQLGKVEYSSEDLILPGSYLQFEWNF
jgi:pimeloyl-ACP methyl ester carboxylesterase